MARVPPFASTQVGWSSRPFPRTRAAAGLAPRAKGTGRACAAHATDSPPFVNVGRKGTGSFGNLLLPRPHRLGKLPKMRAVSMGRCNTGLKFTSGRFKA